MIDNINNMGIEYTGVLSIIGGVAVVIGIIITIINIVYKKSIKQLYKTSLMANTKCTSEGSTKKISIELTNDGESILVGTKCNKGLFKTKLKLEMPDVSKYSGFYGEPGLKIFDYQKVHNIIYKQRIKDIEKELSSYSGLGKDDKINLYYGDIVNYYDKENIILYKYYNNNNNAIYDEDKWMPNGGFQIYKNAIPEVYNKLGLSHFDDGTDNISDALYFFRCKTKRPMDNDTQWFYDNKHRQNIIPFLKELLNNDIIFEYSKKYFIEPMLLTIENTNDITTLDGSKLDDCINRPARLLTEDYLFFIKDGFRTLLPNNLMLSIKLKNNNSLLSENVKLYVKINLTNF